jgi:hypothetical protein
MAVQTEIAQIRKEIGNAATHLPPPIQKLIAEFAATDIFIFEAAKQTFSMKRAHPFDLVYTFRGIDPMNSMLYVGKFMVDLKTGQEYGRDGQPNLYVLPSHETVEFGPRLTSFKYTDEQGREAKLEMPYAFDAPRKVVFNSKSGEFAILDDRHLTMVQTRGQQCVFPIDADIRDIAFDEPSDELIVLTRGSREACNLFWRKPSNQQRTAWNRDRKINLDDMLFPTLLVRGPHLYVAESRTPSIFVLDKQTGAHITRLAVDFHPILLGCSCDGSNVFVGDVRDSLRILVF